MPGIWETVGQEIEVGVGDQPEPVSILCTHLHAPVEGGWVLDAQVQRMGGTLLAPGMEVTFPDQSKGVLTMAEIHTEKVDVTTEDYWQKHRKRQYRDGMTSGSIRIVGEL